MQIVDTRGLSCPQPVIETKKAIDAKAVELQVLVDTIAAKENVSRYAKASKFSVSTAETEYGWTLELKKL